MDPVENDVVDDSDLCDVFSPYSSSFFFDFPDVKKHPSKVVEAASLALLAPKRTAGILHAGQQLPHDFDFAFPHSIARNLSDLQLDGIASAALKCHKILPS